jgi:VanZ family protein
LHIPINLSRATGACILFTIGLFMAGLWPFNFRADNHAVLMPEGKGLRFDAPLQRSKQDLGGIAFTPEPLSCQPQSVCEPGELTIQIGLIAANEVNSCVKRILDIRRPDGSPALYLGQWKASLLLRWSGHPKDDSEPYHEIGVEGVLATGLESVITIVSGPSGTSIFVDGRLRKSLPGVGLFNEDESLGGHKLYFGNSPELSCPWAGSIRAFGIYGTAWTPAEAQAGREARIGSRWTCGNGSKAAAACYQFDRLQGEFISDESGCANHLWIPGLLVFEKELLSLPEHRHISVFDFTSNLIGFIPFGFLVCRLGKLVTAIPTAKKLFFLTVMIGFAASLTIESIQVWLPGRDSSALDLVLNTAGTAIGALFTVNRGFFRHQA